MNAMDVWLAIGLLVLATFLTRSPFFLFGHAVRMPLRLQHALRYAPAAAMAAIILPDLLTNGGVPDLHWANPKLLAGIAGALIFVVTRNMLGTIIGGMLMFSLLRQFL
ncbi:AzlD domain-containing protein [Herbaspirillum sp. RTI4]|uniref:AzlD domain-containing protein n=1 Tax=Herbaspirillum sp. RTI4 TaxID=3048640 RepID=UPI002AB49125|nr:AzlD domain-containing protein [Herbaspirillum sp. RTI4]MDY7576799.1 AzlD domain-containing protein [Herbaspirillum sp. RTI4]MEA9981395.1 AzlD domain-containing protein [Herbaspirillum sp. RTI4]